MLRGRPRLPSSSARKAARISCLTSYVSCGRLRNLQAILHSGSGEEDRPDAVLCILGVDSRFDEGHKDATRYLLFDCFQKDGEQTVNEDDAETFEDILLLITQSAVHVYCNPYNYPHLLPYIAHWPNLRLHCLNKTEYDQDSDFAEDFKVLSFLEMCRGSRVIGMPFGTRGRPVSCDPFLIEKWPIVQASALEDYGGGGFFTMKHKIVDINKELWTLLDYVDPVHLEVLVTRDLPLIEKQWSNMLTNVDLAFSASSFQELTEKDVAEPLLSFFAFENLARLQSPGSTQRIPYCLFGRHSASAERLGDSERTLGSAGINSSLAKHMVCQVVASNIACSRTYFCLGGHNPYPLSGGVVQPLRPPKTDVELLEKLYKAVIASVLGALDTYIHTGSVTEARESCLKSMKKTCVEDIIPTGLELLKTCESVDFFLHGVDGLGNPEVLGDGSHRGSLKLIGLKLLDIPSIEHPGNVLGSVEFSETFLDSQILLDSDGTITVDSRSLVLTSRIPRSMTWEMGQSKENLQNTMQQFLHSIDQPFGEVLIEGVHCSALGSMEMGVVTEGALYVCEEAVLFVDTGNNLAIFPLSYTEEITLFDGGSFTGVSVLSVSYRHSLQQYLPLSYHSIDDIVMFLFTPKTKAHRMFYSEVVSRWQSRTTDPVLKTLESLPDSMKEMYRGLQVKYAAESASTTEMSSLLLASADLPGFESFLAHLTASSSLGDSPLPTVDLPAILREQTEARDPATQEDKIVVSLLTGAPGSHQEELCNALVNMAKENNRWMVLKPPLESGEFFRPQVIHDALTSVYNAARKQRQSVRAVTGGRKKMRALMVVPPFTSTATVVYSILNHPMPEVASVLSVGSITCCLDPLNVFLSNRLTFPLLQDQCMTGWVNNVLFTGSTDEEGQDIEYCENLIRRTNPDVTFILAEKGEIRRSSDAEAILSETAFMETDMIRARHLMIPGWWRGEGSSRELHPAFNKICLQFYQPLERSRFVSSLQSLHSSAVKGGTSEKIYHIRGTTKFTDSEELSEVYFTTLSGYLSLVAAPSAPLARPPSAAPPIAGGDNHCGYSLLFIGSELDESSVKSWLKKSAKQKPAKQPLKTLQSLKKEEIAKIHDEHHLDPLPEGWFYNGSQYVSLMGEKQQKHPNIDTFLEQYLQSTNQRIEESNRLIDSANYFDLFEPIS